MCCFAVYQLCGTSAHLQPRNSNMGRAKTNNSDILRTQLNRILTIVGLLCVHTQQTYRQQNASVATNTTPVTQQVYCNMLSKHNRRR